MRTLPGILLFARPLGELPAYMTRVTRRHGPFVRFRGPTRSLYLLSAPRDVEAVFVTQAAAFHKGRGVERLRPLLGNGLLTAEQPSHLRNRRLVQPAFHRERLDGYARIMLDATQRRIAGWRDGERIDVGREMLALALEIVGRSLFGADVHHAGERISAALDDAMASFETSMSLLGPLFDRLPNGSMRRFERARATLHGEVERLIAKRRAGGERGDDVLSLLMREDEGPRPGRDAQIRDEVLTLLLAGHETTANALTWSFYLLGRHPEIAARLRARLHTGAGEQRPRAQDATNPDYVRAVVAESIRLYPPAWAIGRRAIRDVTIGGRRIAAGDLVLTSPYVTQRDAGFFPEPDRFIPERFLAAEPRERFAYFPFGGGNRICIGESFAWLEATLVLATVAASIRLEPLDDRPVPLRPVVTLRPGRPIVMRVRRESPETNALPRPRESPELPH